MLRRTTDVFSRYNREKAFHVKRGVTVGVSMLDALAANEVQMMYLFVRWSNCTDVGYALAGLKIEPKGAFARPTDKQIQDALKDMMV